MSTATVEPRLKRTWGLYEVYIGKKLVMAGTGVILVLYIIGHLLGNLQIYAGPEQMNQYAAFLHSQPGLLWTARIVLLAAVGAHIWSSLLLWLEKRRARPVGYIKKDNVPASYASRTMMWSGPIVAAFVIFHVLHLTTGDVGLGYQPPAPGPTGEVFHAYENVVNGFRHPAVSAAYIFAIALLTMHLYHGLWSMFQSVGISHPRYTPLLKRLAHVFSIAIATGYISIPLYVMIRFGVK
ncbi:MAG: succinate dehydrogenase cytochrome b subunit [Rhodospirillales bacterium]